uniref:Uncharacterized protein n=1 Tax=Arundo donax TaxID=35708 RepID=A0A0A9BMT5_ARUDO
MQPTVSELAAIMHNWSNFTLLSPSHETSSFVFFEVQMKSVAT